MNNYTIHEYLNDYIKNFDLKYQNSNMRGGDYDSAVKGYITAGNFKGVINHYFEGSSEDILNLKLKDDKKVEFKANQVQIVKDMLAKVDSVKVVPPPKAPGFINNVLDGMYNSFFGGMNGGALPKVGDLPTDIKADMNNAQIYGGILAVAAHIIADPAPPVVAPPVVAPPVVAPVVSLSTPPKLTDLTQLIINFVNGDGITIVKPELSTYKSDIIIQIDKTRINNDIDKLLNSRRSKRQLNTIINDLSAVWNSETDRTNKRGLNILRNDLNAIKNSI